MLFHKISETLHRWLREQPNVKEESLTDWFLFELSKDRRIKYYSFTRHEEAMTGADWDWWVLTSGCAFRFRVQAKKLKPEADNWASISYGNKNGIQIDLLLESADKESAFPMYFFYSSLEPNIDKQRNCFNDEEIIACIEWCKTCSCGGFLSPASSVYTNVFDRKKAFLHAEMLLNIAIKLSSLDYFLCDDGVELSSNAVYERLSRLNTEYIQDKSESREYSNQIYHGFRYEYENKSHHFSNREGNTIPNWLMQIINDNINENEQGISAWFEQEYRHQLPKTSGVAVIDLRYDESGIES